jgi:hypothetical protein
MAPTALGGTATHRALPPRLLPAPLAALAYQNKTVVYDVLIRASAETLLTMHTWGQNLHHHPHVHCVVPGGGLCLYAQPPFAGPERRLALWCAQTLGIVEVFEIRRRTGGSLGSKAF